MAPLLLFGAAIGGAAMYLFDPDHGRRRRARIRDDVTRAQTDVRDFVDAGTRDLKNRGTVLMGRTRSLMRRHKASDSVLVERVRSKMGRYVGHPGAIEVSALDGEVTLSGSILAHEHGELIDAVQDVPGVKRVHNELSVYETAAGISELQGESRHRGARAELWEGNWAPGPRLLASVGATMIALHALRRHGIMRLVTLTAGSTLFLRAVTNKPLRTLAGKDGARGIDVQKTIHINAPIEEVYRFLANYENFPTFMRNVRSVQVLPDGRSHWVVAGPLNTPVEWDAFTLRSEPDKLIEWSTVEGSAVEHAGTVRVDSSGDGMTRLHVRMSYNPPAGALGHIVARLFGADPKSEMDEDLMRLKSRLETGKAPHDPAVQSQSQSQSMGTPV
jgi:uncharacterized membrane protein